MSQTTRQATPPSLPVPLFPAPGARPGLRWPRGSAAALTAGALLVTLGSLGLAGLIGSLPRGTLPPLTLYALVVGLVLRWLREHHPHDRFGLANTLTLMRAALVALLAGLAFAAATPVAGWLALLLAVVGLGLDGVDGWAARRSGLGSAFGARFDMEVDNLLLLVVALLLVVWGKAGVWVLAVGLLHPGFTLLGRRRPWLRRPLPPSLRRKSAFALAATLMLAGLAPILGGGLSTAMAGLALALLVASFLLDIGWLRRHAVPDDG